MKDIYLNRLREFASIDIAPSIIKSIAENGCDDDSIDNNELIDYLSNIINSDGTGLSQDEMETYSYFKFANFFLRSMLSLMEIDAFYNLETTFLNTINAISIPKEERVGINGAFNILQTLPEYYYLTLIKSIEDSDYFQEDLIDCIVQNNKKEFVEILKKERCNINSLLNTCSFYKRMTNEIGMLKSTEINDISDEELKRAEVKSCDMIQYILEEEAAQVYQNDISDFIAQLADAAILQYWQEETKEKYTTTEKNILDGIINDIKTTPQYISLYNEYHKDGVFYPDGVDNVVEYVKIESVDKPEPKPEISALPQTPAEPLIICLKYEGGGELYCNNINRNGDPTLTLDKYFTTNYKRLMNLLNELVKLNCIREEEVNSYFTHFSGMGSNHIVLQTLHWDGSFPQLCYIISLLYPDRQNGNMRYEPIKKHIKYNHNSKSYKNGTDYSSAAARPGSDIERLIKRLYHKEEIKPYKIQKR